MEKIATGLYEHYKGMRYEVVGSAVHSETEEWMVIYKALYECEDYPERTLWVRPLEMFTENVTIEGQTIPRFKFIG